MRLRIKQQEIAELRRFGDALAAASGGKNLAVKGAYLLEVPLGGREVRILVRSYATELHRSAYHSFFPDQIDGVDYVGIVQRKVGRKFCFLSDAGRKTSSEQSLGQGPTIRCQTDHPSAHANIGKVCGSVFHTLCLLLEMGISHMHQMPGKRCGSVCSWLCSHGNMEFEKSRIVCCCSARRRPAMVSISSCA